MRVRTKLMTMAGFGAGWLVGSGKGTELVDRMSASRRPGGDRGDQPATVTQLFEERIVVTDPGTQTDPPM